MPRDMGWFRKSGRKSETPILDLEEPYRPRPQNPIKFTVLFLLYLSAGMVLAGDNSVGAYTWLFSVPFVVLLHELGHAFAAKLVGYPVRSITVFGLQYSSGKLKLARDAVFGGWVGFGIPSLVAARRKTLWVIAGGPLANVLSGAAFLVLSTQLSGPAAALLQSLGYLSLFNLTETVLPSVSPAKGRYNDGKFLLLLLRRGKAFRGWLALNGLELQRKRKVRFADQNRRWMRVARESGYRGASAWLGHYLSYNRFVKAEDISAAAQQLERVLFLTVSRTDIRKTVFCYEATVFQAWHKKDLIKAEEWMERAKAMDDGTLPQILTLRAEIALDSARFDFESAQSKLQAALAIKRQKPDFETGDDTEWLEWSKDIEDRRLAAKALSTEADPAPQSIT